MLRKTFGLITALTCTAGALAQVDTCGTGSPVGDGAHAFDTSSATNDGPGSCGASATSPDVWFDFVAPLTGISVFSTCGGSANDTVLSLFDACGGNELLCLDDFCGLQTQISYDVTAGVHYQVRVAGFVGQIVSGTLTISTALPPPPPPNDNCNNATPVSEGTHPFTNVGATEDGSSSCGAGGGPGYQDIWYNYNPSTTGPVLISFCGQTGLDTQVSVHDAPCGAELACSDDSCFLQSEFTATVTAGVHVWIRVASWSATAVGSGTFSITAIVPPANDDCATATPVTEGTAAFTTLGAADSTAAASCGFDGSPGYNDVWYRFTPATSGNGNITVCNTTDLDTIINVYDACGGAEIGCNDDSCGLQSSVIAPVTAGVPVWVRIANWAQGDIGSGEATFRVFPPLTNDNCAQAIALVPGIARDFSTIGANVDGTGSCGASAQAPDIWYSFQTGPTPGGLFISTCGSDYDTVLSVFDACGGTEIACLDDGCGLQTPLNICTAPANTNLRIRVSGFAGQSGTGTITLTVTAPGTPYSPPAGCTPEGENCAQVNPDSHNGGCNSEPDTYQNISLCTDYCATAAQDGTGFRDTDWFNITLPGPGTLTVTGQTQFNAQWFVLPGASSIDCFNIPLLAISNSNGCDPNLTISFTTSGEADFIFFASPRNFTGDSACEVNENYWFRATFDAAPCAAVCDPDFNCDGNVDQEDVACIINVVAGNAGCECQDPDFNRDGNVDQEDVSNLINVVAGGNCP